jgi:hypothetical protein
MTEITPLPTLSRLTGLLLLTGSVAAMAAGQLLLSFGRDFIDAQRPVDWAHLLLLAGAAGGAIGAARLPLGRLGYVGWVLTTLGALAFSGMVALDLLLWGIPQQPIVDDALDQALGSPLVAVPFLWVGPSLFFIGLTLLSAEWVIRRSRVAMLVIAGLLGIGLGTATGIDGVTLASFAITLVGLGAVLATNGHSPLDRRS